MSSTLDEKPEALHGAVCQSYQAIDDFRTLLPLATGTGVFLLLSGKAGLPKSERAEVADALIAVGVFGFTFTCGLFAFELYGIKKCHHLIATGQRLERGLRVPGQFGSRPYKLGGLINEPFASAIIYPASMASWAFLAFALSSEAVAVGLAVGVFVVGFVATLLAAEKLAANAYREDRVLDLIAAGPCDLRAVQRKLGVRRRRAGRIVRRLEKQGHLEREGSRLRVSGLQQWRVPAPRTTHGSQAAVP